MTGGLPAGFPHSDIRGSQLICSSPQLFAAYHVFLRLLVPRHPSCALVGLTCSFRTSVYVFCFFRFFSTYFFIGLVCLGSQIFLLYLWFRSVFCFQGASGDGEIRTLDPLLARQVLSQLSYTPICSGVHLFSRAVSSKVPSAAQALTVVFGMGTGVSPARFGTGTSGPLDP